MIENYGAYQFRYCHDVASPGKVRVYIESQPSYNGRPSDSASTHRIPSSNGAPPHICIKEDCKPESLSEAKNLAHRWAQSNDNYRRTGRFS